MWVQNVNSSGVVKPICLVPGVPKTSWGDYYQHYLISLRSSEGEEYHLLPPTTHAPQQTYGNSKNVYFQMHRLSLPVDITNNGKLSGVTRSGRTTGNFHTQCHTHKT